ncbi:including n-acetylases of ribosomal protein [Melanomma pulvis-pyrius CBS 109.77]|uniref:Including n-acetylases of ribosomal protein n=1 Tax=Melanomma pulvis-pyrius CBS 109.77 TaxID=1314802 RepID=A0A6A6XXC5_9PLEO|nr:including n-acetylases of ribosomal protein [Melanomma pulvis-pyrius CBS 109.77]
MTTSNQSDEPSEGPPYLNFHPAFLIETTRLYITHLLPENEAHSTFLVDLHKGQQSPYSTQEAARTQIQTTLRQQHEENGYGKYLMSLKPTPAPTDLTTGFQELLQQCPLVGIVSLKRVKSPISYVVPDISFITHPAHARQGYAKEAASAVLGMAKTFLGVKEVVGFCDLDNEAAKATLRSLEFENRGEMELKAFDGKRGLVWVQPGMAEDISVYGF